MNKSLLYNVNEIYFVKGYVLFGSFVIFEGEIFSKQTYLYYILMYCILGLNVHKCKSINYNLVLTEKAGLRT